MSTNQKLWPSEMAASRKSSRPSSRTSIIRYVLLLQVVALVGLCFLALDDLLLLQQMLTGGLQPMQLASTAGK